MSDRQLIEQQIRDVLREHAHLGASIDSLAPDDDLYQVGMSSHASVNVMLGLEAKFDLEFPDRMLKRSVFGSVAAIRVALEELLSGRPM
jgi:acyl carrier protein